MATARIDAICGELDPEGVADDLAVRAPRPHRHVAVDGAAELADDDERIAGADRADLRGVRVEHARREIDLDVAGDRDRRAEAQLADEALEIVFGVGLDQIPAGVVGEGAQEHEIGAGAHRHRLDPDPLEGRLQVAEELVGRELAGAGVAVAEVDDHLLARLRPCRGAHGLGGGAHHPADIAGAGEGLSGEEGVEDGEVVGGRRVEAAGGRVAGGVAGEHGQAIVVAEGAAHRPDQRARGGPQLRRRRVRAVEDEDVAGRPCVWLEGQVGLDRDHEVGLAVLVEVGLCVHPPLRRRQRDVDAEIVDRAEVLLLGGQLDPVGELAAIEVGHRRPHRLDRVRRQAVAVDVDRHREVADRGPAGAGARAAERVAIAEVVADRRQHLGVAQADLAGASPGDREDLELEDVALLPLEQRGVAGDRGVDDLLEDPARALLLEHRRVLPGVADQQGEAGDRRVRRDREAVGPLEHRGGLVIEGLLDLRQRDPAGDRHVDPLVDQVQGVALDALAGATGCQGADTHRHRVGHLRGEVEAPGPGGLLERAEADDRLGRLGGGQRSAEGRASAEVDGLAVAGQARAAVDHSVVMGTIAAKSTSLALCDAEDVIVTGDEDRLLAGGDDRDQLAADQLDPSRVPGRENELRVSVETDRAATVQGELGEGPLRDRQPLPGVELGPLAEEGARGEICGLDTSGAGDREELGDVGSRGRTGPALAGVVLNRGRRLGRLFVAIACAALVAAADSEEEEAECEGESGAVHWGLLLRLATRGGAMRFVGLASRSGVASLPVLNAGPRRRLTPVGARLLGGARTPPTGGEGGEGTCERPWGRRFEDLRAAAPARRAEIGRGEVARGRQ